MSAFSALLLAQAFAYTVVVDPMTDERLYTAQIGTDRGPSITLFCGASTERKLQVAVNVGKALYSRPFSQFARYKSRVRFGTAEPVEFGFQYIDREAYLSDANAETFAGRLADAEHVVVELYDYSNDKVTVRYPTAGARDSLAKVRAACASR